MQKPPASPSKGQGRAGRWRRNPGRTRLAVALSLSAIALVACSGSSNQAGGSATDGGCKLVRLFGVQPLTGPGAAPGTQAQDGGELAVKQVNDAGGFKDSQGTCYKLELTRNDMASEAAQAVSLFRGAATDQSFLAQIGPTSSTGFVPVAALAESLKMLVISNGSVANLKAWNGWAYRVNSVNDTSMPPALTAVHKATNFSRMAVLYDQTNDGQAQAATLIESKAAEIGYEVVYKAGFDPAKQDFSSQITQLKAANPDMVAVMSAVAAGGTITSQLHSGGVTVPEFTPDGTGVDPTWWDNSKGAIKGSYTYLGADIQNAKGDLKSFVDAFKAAYPNIGVANYPIWGYQSVMVVVEAIKKANSADRDKVQVALSSLTATTINGTITFKNPPNGNNLTPNVVVVRVTGNGTYESVG